LQPIGIAQQRISETMLPIEHLKIKQFEIGTGLPQRLVQTQPLRSE
jgi:hypothetical protein